MKIAIDSDKISLLFPYHMVVDTQLMLLQVGAGFYKYPDGPRPGKYVLDYFRWLSDDPLADFARIAKNGEFLRLACIQDRALFDGMAVPIEGGYLLAMNQIPAVFSLEDADWQMSDFGMSDPLVPALLLVSLQRALLDETLQMAKELAAEREKNVYLIDRGRRFAGYTAHDFNNLLSIIKLNCNRLANPDMSRPDKLRLVTIIEETAARGSEIARALMTLANQKHDSPQIVVVDELLAEQSSYFVHIAGVKVTVNQDLQAPGVTVLASASGLINSVINLVINARQAMHHGGTITIATCVKPVAISGTASADSRKTDCVVITVSDTGPGMSEDVMRRAFEPFFSTKPHGSGMGLASVREFALEMGGNASCESIAGGGASIRIHLPVVDVTGQADRPPSCANGNAIPGKIGAGISILVVEDEPYALEALAETLEALGYAVTCAATADEGMAQLQQRHFDILLSDVKLHEDSGIELATLAWRDQHVDRVVLMSGYVPDADQLDSHWGFVRKPLDVENLVQMIRAPT